MASRVSAKYSPRVSKALALYERLLEAEGRKRDVLVRWISDLLDVMDPSESEAYYRHIDILRRSYELRLKDASRAHRG